MLNGLKTQKRLSGLDGPFDARSVANRILELAAQKNLPITVMQLVKLIYLAHGWWLTYTNGSPLTTTRPEAWKFGPVYREVYDEFKDFNGAPISSRAVDQSTGFEYHEEMSDKVNSLLDQIVSSYGKHHAYKLSSMLHQPGTPWSITTQDRGHYAPINNNLIREHFDEIREKYVSR